MFFSIHFQITENRLRELFGEKGHITDVQLKYTKDGVFRQFAFVGYQSDAEADAAVEHFNNTCIQTSRLKVEICAALGADTKPKAWSKYSTESSAYKKLNEPHQNDEDKDDGKAQKKAVKTEKKKKKNERLEEIYGEHKDDPNFIEFLKVHGNANDIWDNDLGLAAMKDDEAVAPKADAKTKKTKTEIVIANGNDDDNEEDDGSESDSPDDKLANLEISDADYLKSLKNKKEQPKTETKTKKAKKETEKNTDLLTIKIREIPFNTKRQDVIKFFKPVRPFSIRLPTRDHGFCYVGFKSEKEFKAAMLRNRSFLKGKQLLFTDFTEKNKLSAERKVAGKPADIEKTKPKITKNPKWAKQEEALHNEEDISESGRIFFRNLAYTVNEVQVQQMFEKYGPVTDCSLPIDPVTRKIKGFGTVTFVMPENAVQAFNELDGTVFHGRLLHLLPGKSKEDDELDVSTEGLSYKQKKELLQKKQAGSSHNWNTLFMGADAVAESLARNYKTSKEEILDTAGGGSSAAVRLALGETELIMEMRKFLESNDVVLDVFDRVPKKRSKTVILAKNLPANTVLSEIQPLFAKFGLLGRIVLPPSGVTAIVEFLEPSEAKKAFSKLAYSKFKDLPLYLEWAPENTFKTAATTPMKMDATTSSSADETKPAKRLNAFSKVQPVARAGEREGEEESNDQIENESHVMNEDKIEEEEDTTDAETGTTLFLRNLNFTTREDAIRRHFKHVGRIHHIQVAMKKDPDNPTNRISLGYGFIQFKLHKDAEKALKTMQITNIEGNSVELKRSDRTLQ